MDNSSDIKRRMMKAVADELGLTDASEEALVGRVKDLESQVAAIGAERQALKDQQMNVARQLEEAEEMLRIWREMYRPADPTLTQGIGV